MAFDYDKNNLRILKLLYCAILILYLLLDIFYYRLRPATSIQEQPCNGKRMFSP